MSARRRRRNLQPFNPRLRDLLGATLIDRITDTDRTRAPLRIGSEVWSTHRMAQELGVVHTKAARLLTAAADSINARNVRDLYRRSSPYTFAGIKGLGETAIYVLWRLFESRGLDCDAWATAGDAKAATVTFQSLKKREQAAEARTMRDARNRRRSQVVASTVTH